MTQDITPFDFSKFNIRHAVIDGVIWPCLVDFCKHLGLSERRAQYYGKELSTKGECTLAALADIRGQVQNTWVVSPKGILYIFKNSNKEIPQQWRDTVLRDVIEDGAHISQFATIEQLDRAVEIAEYGILRHMLAQATDYDQNSMIVQRFFGRMRNAFYLTVVGLDAKQILCEREGEIRSFKGTKPTSTELKVAANYLVKDEQELLKLHITHSIAQTRIHFFKKEYSMKEFVRAIESGLSKFWEK